MWALGTERGVAMQGGYFATAWVDIKQSPKWFGKVMVLALLGVIPVFGQIVLCGYALGWARDIAWNVRTPLPARVLGNEDGKLYSRGFFALVIAVVCALAPWVVIGVWSAVVGAGSSWGSRHGFAVPFFSLIPLAFLAVSVAVTLAASLVYLVGSVRMAVYGRLSAGLQIGRIWTMLRHDFTGALRVLGMLVLLTVVIEAVFVAVAFAVLGGCGVILGLTVSLLQAAGGAGAVAAFVPAALMLWLLALVGTGVLYMASSAFVTLMTARAMGYWVRQFDVPAWRGQDDPLPFEAGYAAAAAAAPGASASGEGR